MYKDIWDILDAAVDQGIAILDADAECLVKAYITPFVTSSSEERPLCPASQIWGMH